MSRPACGLSWAGLVPPSHEMRKGIGPIGGAPTVVSRHEISDPFGSTRDMVDGGSMPVQPAARNSATLASMSAHPTANARAGVAHPPRGRNGRGSTGLGGIWRDDFKAGRHAE